MIRNVIVLVLITNLCTIGFFNAFFRGSRSLFDLSASPVDVSTAVSAESCKPCKCTNEQDATDDSTAQLPWLFLITPTYPHLNQKAELTRLAQTLMHIKHLHWIVIEDHEEPTLLVENVLSRSGVLYTHLHQPRPENNTINGTRIGGKGMLARNCGLQWLRENYETPPSPGAVVYMADDDNTYDLRLFAAMRKVKGIGVTAVGYAGGLKIEKPEIAYGHVTKWDVMFLKKRRFATDMAGFAINMQLILDNPDAEFPLQASQTFESEFLSKFNFVKGQLELFGMDVGMSGKREVLVWHSKSHSPNLSLESKYRNITGHSSDFGFEL